MGLYLLKFPFRRVLGPLSRALDGVHPDVLSYLATGVAAGTGLCYVYAADAPALLLAAGISILGICGDLVVSFIKRDLRLKDMGSAIPAHGGLLDRCDSLILAAPAFFHAMRYFHAA